MIFLIYIDVFLSSNSLNCPIVYAHPPRKDPLTCPNPGCGERFWFWDALATHVTVHHPSFAVVPIDGAYESHLDA